MIPFKDRAADKMKRATATWTALFGMLIFIVGWIILRNVLQVPVDNPQLTILNLILSSLAGLQCFILLIAAKRGEAMNEEIVRMTAKETERLAKVEQKVDDLIESTEKNFEALNYKFDQFTRHANTSFITVAQAKVAAWFIGFTVSVVGIAVLIWSHMTK